MNAVLRLVVMSIASLGLAACASSGGTASVAPAASEPGTVVQDNMYINHVERTARRRGIHVQWVNPPTKRVAVN